MLTHRNFTALVAKLAGVVRLRRGRRPALGAPAAPHLRVLRGLLTPFSRGAEITYLDELTADRLGDVLETGRITAMIGVPALWQLLHRKITQELAAAPAIVEQAIQGADVARTARCATGRTSTWASSSSGRCTASSAGASSSWSPAARRSRTTCTSAFHELGFDLAEGYGLTEAAPVLSVQSPGNKRMPGSVGARCPASSCASTSPDNDGIGEVLRPRAQRDGGLLRRTARPPTPASRTAGCTPETSGGSTPTGSSTWWAARRTSSSTPTGRTCTRTSSRSSTASTRTIKELSVVGLPDDAGGEKVACLCVPDYKERPPRGGACASWRSTSAGSRPSMPFYRRVKVLRFWDGELPQDLHPQGEAQAGGGGAPAAGAAGRLRREGAAPPHARAARSDWL